MTETRTAGSGAARRARHARTPPTRWAECSDLVELARRMQVPAADAFRHLIRDGTPTRAGWSEGVAAPRERRGDAGAD